MAKKKKITLTETEFGELLFESFKKALEGTRKLAFNIDISKINIEELRHGYKDFRLVPLSYAYGSALNSPVTIKEAYGDIMPPDEVVGEILKKYALPQSLVFKIEHFHEIYIYSIIAHIGINDKLIEDDMSKMGYFIGARGPVQTVEDMQFQVLQFEPSSQLQNDVTEEVRQKYARLFHWTPYYNVNSILTNGLIPSHKNEIFNYPPRTYFMGEDCDTQKMAALGQQLCMTNNNSENNGKYALLTVDIKNIGEDVRFYYDPNSEIGIFSEQTIPSKNIKLNTVVQFVKDLKNDGGNKK